MLIGHDVIVLGYPLGWHDSIHNLPVIRSGVISSAFLVPFCGHPYFLIDARLHQGTSGAPVLSKPSLHMISLEKQSTTGWKYAPSHEFQQQGMYLLGILSTSFDFPEERRPLHMKEENKPLDLNAVYYASIIDEMTSK